MHRVLADVILSMKEDGMRKMTSSQRKNEVYRVLDDLMPSWVQKNL